jgi:hypothetical protein
MKIYKPKTIQEAINNLQVFLECDLYTRFRPAQTLPIGRNGKDKTWYRDSKDVFKSERELLKYLESHFNLLKKQVKKLEKRNFIF